MALPILILCVVLFVIFLFSPKEQREARRNRRARSNRRGGGLPWMGPRRR